LSASVADLRDRALEHADRTFGGGDARQEPAAYKKERQQQRAARDHRTGA
jgi:hypothetical protein